MISRVAEVTERRDAGDTFSFNGVQFLSRFAGLKSIGASNGEFMRVVKENC